MHVVQLKAASIGRGSIAKNISNIFLPTDIFLLFLCSFYIEIKINNY